MTPQVSSIYAGVCLSLGVKAQKVQLKHCSVHGFTSQCLPLQSPTYAAAEVCPQAPPPSCTSPHPSPLPPATETECTCPSSPTCSQATGTGDLSPQSQVVRDYQALAIALPIALITILITVAIVGVGVALCIRGRVVRKKEPRWGWLYTGQVQVL